MSEPTKPSDPLVWEVHFAGQDYDSDPRGSGAFPVDERLYIIAHTHAEAKAKAEPELKKLRRKYPDKSSVRMTIVDLDELTVARNCSGESRLGFSSVESLEAVALSLAADKQNYRLVVRLEPVPKADQAKKIEES